MKLNIMTLQGIKEVKAKMIDFPDFKMFAYKDEHDNWIPCEYFSGMSLGDGFYHKTFNDAYRYAIDGYYGGDYWKGRLAERIAYINEQMLKPNLEKYGYANK